MKADDSAKGVTVSRPEVISRMISCMGTPQMCKLVPHYISSDSLIIKALYTDKLGQLSKINYPAPFQQRVDPSDMSFQNFFHQNTKIHPLQILHENLSSFRNYVRFKCIWLTMVHGHDEKFSKCSISLQVRRTRQIIHHYHQK